MTEDRRGTDPRVVPVAFVERARQFYAAGAVPVSARRAATMVLLRDAPLRVYLIKRAATMAFAGGLYAFPGGGVEDGDADVASAGVREVLEETGATVAAQRAWSRWITPEFEPRRYDTWFYVAVLADGVAPRIIGTEAEWAAWITPTQALARHADAMLPPTAVVLSELAEYTTVEDVFTAAELRDMTPVLPRLLLTEDPPRVTLPGDPDYDTV